MRRTWYLNPTPSQFTHVQTKQKEMNLSDKNRQKAGITFLLFTHKSFVEFNTSFGIIDKTIIYRIRPRETTKLDSSGRHLATIGRGYVFCCR